MRWIMTHEGGIEALAVAADGTVITCGVDGRVIAWRGSGEVILERQPGRHARTVATSHDGTIVLGLHNGHVLRVRGGTIDEPFGTFDDGHAGVGCVAVSPDGRHVAIGAGLTAFAIHTMDGDRVWSGKTYKWPYVVAFSRFDRRVLCATWQPDLHIVDLDALPPQGDLYGDYPGQGPVFDAAFLADGRVVTVGATDDKGFVRVDDVAIETEEGIHAVVALDDLIVAGGNDQAITFYDARTLEEKRRVVLGEPWQGGGQRLPEIPSHAAFYSPSGPLAVIGLALRGDTIVCATAGGRVLEVPVSA